MQHHLYTWPPLGTLYIRNMQLWYRHYNHTNNKKPNRNYNDRPTTT